MQEERTSQTYFALWRRGGQRKWWGWWRWRQWKWGWRWRQ